MARENTDNAGQATEAAARAGGAVAAETMKAAERASASAVRAGETAAGEATDRFGAAANAYAGAVEAAFKAAQEYNAKLVQAFQTNAQANIELGRTLMETRSPTDFIETMSRSMRERTELVAGLTKDLAALRQEAARRMIEAMTPGR